MQLVHVEGGGVDDDVGLGLHRLEERPLPLDGVGQALPRGEQRMAPAGALVATHEHLGARRPGTAAGRGRPTERMAPRPGSRSAWWAPAPTTRATRGVAEPGDRTSSTTLGMSSEGRLSMTNQPRSSSASAACERPAPDNPVMITNSLMRGPSSRSGGSRRRGMVAAACVLCRTGEEAWWRGGLLHAPQHQPGVGQRVDVPGQRTVDERDEDALLHLLDGLVLDQVGADPPVLLGRIEDLVVDPAAVGRLEQRVVQEEEEPPAGRQDPCHLGDGGVDVA